MMAKKPRKYNKRDKPYRTTAFMCTACKHLRFSVRVAEDGHVAGFACDQCNRWFPLNQYRRIMEREAHKAVRRTLEVTRG